MQSYKCWDITDILTVQYYDEFIPGVGRRAFIRINDHYASLLHEELVELIEVLQQISKANQEE